MSVFKKMNLVQSELATVGIEKGQKNNHGNYYFRGIDDVQNALAGLLAKHKLLIVPSVIGKTHQSMTTSGGKPTNHWSVRVEYLFVDAESDGPSTLTSTFAGEAYDTSDKGLQKAITSAYKYMLFETFCIPVEGSVDADADHAQVEEQLLGEAEQEEVLGLCMLTNTDPNAFAEWLGYKGLNAVPMALYAKCVAALSAKRKKLAETAAEQAATNQSIEDENNG